MRLIDKRTTDLIAGYDIILRAETELRQLWRPKLLAAYAQRQQIYEQGQKHYRRGRIFPLIGALAGIAGILAGGGLSCNGFVSKETDKLLACCGGPLLVLLGLLILVSISFSRLNQDKRKAGRVPLHPLRGKVIPDLRTAWLQGLSGGLKDEVPDYPGHYTDNQKDYGAEGERLFIRQLMESFDDSYCVLARAMQRRHEDVDVILIGPKGVWVFEVKHWSGNIVWDDQGWRRTQTYYERGGAQVSKQAEVGEPPDQQWERAASEVLQTLQYRAPQVLEAHPGMSKVRGGIVFSKDEAQLKIQPGRPVFWGSLNFWIKTLHKVEEKANLDTRSTLQLTVALLERHQELAPIGLRRSMRVYAQGVIQEAEKQLAEWVQA